MKKDRLRAVVDTNLLISGLIQPTGTPRRLFNAFQKSRFILISSPEMLEEFESVLKRPKIMKYAISADEIDLILTSMTRKAQKLTPSTTLPFRIRDPKDKYVLQCALEGNADYLVTGDKDLLVLKEEKLQAKLKIVTVDEFLKQLEE